MLAFSGTRLYQAFCIALVCANAALKSFGEIAREARSFGEIIKTANIKI